jgi:ABC-type transport system involved in multi-copper enzyme maturation permease subunit
MSIFVQGYDTRAGTTASLQDYIPVKTTGYMGIVGTSQAERYDTGFLSIDYAFVVRVILSLLVIFLVYDAIAGERQRGTLKLMLSNPLPRDTILLGKLLGGWCVVTALFTVASAASLLIVLLNPHIRAGADVALRFSGIYLASVGYLTVFFTLGLWVSVMINRPSAALITLLLAWITMTTVYPTLGCLLGERLAPPPGEDRLQSMKAGVQPSDSELNKALEAWVPLRPDNPGYHAARDRCLDIEEKRAEFIYSVDKTWADALGRQASLAVGITFLSPAAIYDQAVMQFAGTSSENYDRFLGYVRTTWDIVCKANRMLFRDRKESQKILESIEPFHPGDMRPDMRKTLLYLGLLGFLSIFFFALAYTGFLRKDVR